MKDRLITLLGAAIAFYILFRLMFPDISFTDEKISLPTSEDRGKFGVAGLKQWLDKSGIATYSLRERYQSLISNPRLPQSGNLLITSLPHRLAARHNESEQLVTWLQDGNHAVFLTAMSDWPQWAVRSKGGTVTDMLSVIGLDMVSAEAEQEDTEDSENIDSEPETAKEKKQRDILAKPVEHPRSLTATLPHPLTENINSLQATWLDSEGINWRLEGESDPRSLLVLFRDNEDQQPAVWLGFMGSGSIIITRHADMFGNLSLRNADNARFISNIITQFVAPDGKVIFDDMHQGLSAIYDPDAFFRDPRLHHTVFFLLALWIIYVMGHTNRFAPVRKHLKSLNLRDHIRGIGNLFARRLHTSAVAQRQCQHFFNEVRSCYGLPQNSEPVWELLETNATISSQELNAVIKTFNRAQQHKYINLVKFINKLNAIRRKLR